MIAQKEQSFWTQPVTKRRLRKLCGVEGYARDPLAEDRKLAGAWYPYWQVSGCCAILRRYCDRGKQPVKATKRCRARPGLSGDDLWLYVLRIYTPPQRNANDYRAAARLLFGGA